jgi:hypothetical protein
VLVCAGRSDVLVRAGQSDVLVRAGQSDVLVSADRRQAGERRVALDPRGVGTFASDMEMPSVPRRMWSLFEPIHAVTYFAPQAGAAFEAAGLRGFWRRYFAGRAAPLGPVGPGPVIAAFFGFAPRMVTRALPDVWTRISPAAALTARAAGARAALAELVPDADLRPKADEADLPPADEAATLLSAAAQAADLLSAAAQAADLPGRVLAGANADLPWPEHPLDRLWHAATLLREHRGDGHVAALLTAGVDGCESLVWRSALEGPGARAGMQAARGWTDDEWLAAADRLRDRAWLDADDSATAAGRSAYAEVEKLTDRLAAGPWERLGADTTDRCARLLEPIASRTWAVLPEDNPIPLRRPARS